MKTKEEYERERAEHQRQFEAVRSEFSDFVTKNFECHEGWFPVLREFFTVVRRVIPVGRERDFELRQVKKFGGLCIYFRTADDLPEADKAALMNAYRAASDSAGRMCEVCGRPAVLRVRNHWFATRCEEHAEGGVLVPPLEDAR